MRKKTNLFDVFNFIFFLVLTLICFYPLWYIIVASISTAEGYYSDAYHIIPKSFTLDNFKYIILDKTVFRAFFVSLKTTVIGTIASIFLTAMAGYCFSKQSLPGMGIMFKLTLVTMYFSGGMVPSYLLISTLQLKNTIASLILPGVIGTFNMILAKNYFESIPESLEEAAHIDGASAFGVFVKIIIPLSKPILATLVLFYAVGYWNSYMNAMLYMTDSKMFTLPVVLKNILDSAKKDSMEQLAASQSSFREGMNMATVLVSLIPILIIYPFLQRYFVKGIMIGAVKG